MDKKPENGITKYEFSPTEIALSSDPVKTELIKNTEDSIKSTASFFESLIFIQKVSFYPNDRFLTCVKKSI